MVGGGHNGLTAAAYLARGGRSVLVLERCERLGGACTLERPFTDERYVFSPCAYVVGLLDRLVIDELELGRHGHRVTLADPNLWCRCRTAARSRRSSSRPRPALSARPGLRRRGHRGPARLRARLRALPAGEELERMLRDEELVSLVFEDSIAEVLDRYIGDERLRHALFAQGLIGTSAGPRDAGTASIKLMHHQGDLLGLGSVWGYVEGGMGRTSFAIAQAALEAGAELASGVPVARMLPGEGGRSSRAS